MKRILLAGACTLALLATTPKVALADIGPGDLGDAADHIVDSIVSTLNELADAVCAYLLMPIENLPTVAAIPEPLPPPVTGDVPTTVPLTPADAEAAAQELATDQAARAAAAEAMIEEVNAPAITNAEQLRALEAMNLTAPVSVAAGQQINTSATIAAAGDAAASADRNQQLLAAGLALQANDLRVREHAAAVALAQSRAVLGTVRGGALVAAKSVDVLGR